MTDFQNKKEESLAGILRGAASKLETQEIVEMSFVDFIEFIPSYSGSSELDPTDLKILSEAFRECGLTSQPHVIGGYVTRSIGSPIYLFIDKGKFDHDSGNYRYGRLLIQTAVIFARIDGVIADEEVDHIVRIINNLGFLSVREKTELKAMSLYFLNVSMGVGGGEQVRAYLRTGLSKKLALQRMESLSNSARLTLIDIAKDVVTSDGVIQRAEIKFLQEIYKSFGLSARSVRSDLEKFAKKNHIQLAQYRRPPIEDEILDEMDDVLGDLVSDFEDLAEYVG